METAVAGVGIMVILVYIVLCVIMVAFSVAAYIFNSLGIYTIAKRRNISKPIFAWIPIANSWLIGAIADHYDEVVNGRKKKSRVIILGLYIASMVILVVWTIVLLIMFSLLATESFNEVVIIILALAVIILYVAIFAALIADMVFLYIALYKVFKSCQPDNAVIYLVLSIVVSVALPVIIFICRNDDKGLLTEETVVE